MSVAILVCLVGALAAPGDAPDDFESFFKEFAAKRAGVQLLEADINEVTWEFGEPFKRQGTLLFGQPRRIIFRYEGDEPTLMVDDRRVYEFDPLEEQLQIYDIEDSPESSIFFLGFDNNPGALRAAYDVRLFTTQNEQGNQGISIRPFKENMENAPFQEVSIYLRDDDFLPYRILINLNDDVRLMTDFSNLKTNQPVAPSETQLRVPENTRIIENGEVTLRSVPAGGLLVPPTALDIPKGVESAPAKEEAPVPENKVSVEVLPAP